MKKHTLFWLAQEIEHGQSETFIKFGIQRGYNSAYNIHQVWHMGKVIQNLNL